MAPKSRPSTKNSVERLAETTKNKINSPEINQIKIAAGLPQKQAQITVYKSKQPKRELFSKKIRS